MCANSILSYFFLHRIASFRFFFCAQFVCVFSFILFCVHCLAKHLPKIHSCINNNAYNILLCYVNNGRVRVFSLCVCVFVLVSEEYLGSECLPLYFPLAEQAERAHKSDDGKSVQTFSVPAKIQRGACMMIPGVGYTSCTHIYIAVFIHYSIIRSKRI